MLDTRKCYCPYCGELIEVVIDTSIESQEYIEDCWVCCQPITITVHTYENETIVNMKSENE